MIDERELVERAVRALAPDEPSFEGLLRRRNRKRRNDRIAAAAVVLAIAILAILAGTILFRAEGGRPAHPTPPPMHNGSIEVFGFTGGVRALAPDGSSRSFDFRCRGQCSEVRGADWSPYGTRLAFTATCGGGCGTRGDPYHGIHVVDPATGADRNVAPGEGFGPLEWSPDGARIAYDTDQGVSVMNADGSEKTPITPVVRMDPYPSRPSWSPDGSRIVYARRGEVLAIDVEDKTSSFLVNGSHPAWSPDGASIAYLAECEVRVITPDGHDDTSLASLAELRPDSAKKGWACDTAADLEWSPDGAELAAMVGRDVFVVNVAGGRAQLVSNRKGSVLYWGLAWRPIP